MPPCVGGMLVHSMQSDLVLISPSRVQAGIEAGIGSFHLTTHISPILQISDARRDRPGRREQVVDEGTRAIHPLSSVCTLVLRISILHTFHKRPRPPVWSLPVWFDASNIPG